QCGYNVTFAPDLKDDDTKQDLRKARLRADAVERDAVLSANIVTDEEFRLHCQNNTATEEITAGYKRYVIEDAVGIAICPSVYEDFKVDRQREVLQNFTDLITDEETVKCADRNEARQREIPLYWELRSKRRELLLEAIRSAFGESGLDSEEELTGADIELRMQEFIATRLVDLKRYFAWKSNQSTNA